MKEVLKSVYRSIPLKKQTFSAIKTFWIPSKDVYKHLHFKGPFKVDLGAGQHFYINNNNSEIENDIFWEGLDKCWEKVSLKLWMQLCPNAEVIFDVGAYTGMYSLAAKCLNPGCEVYTFEPSEDTYNKLVGNNRLNSYDIHCENLGVSDRDGKVEIEGIYQENKFVNSVALDNYIEQNNITRLDLIKIDVEKHEPQVLKGFEKSLNKFKPTMLIESLTDDIGKQIQKYVKDLGYLYFNIDEDNGVRQVHEIRKSDYYNYLLCNEETAKSLNLL